MQDITVTILQTDIIWEQIPENLENLDRKLAPLKNAQDIIVLPEMFCTGFTMNVVQYAEEGDGPIVSWMKNKASFLNAIVTGSVIFKKDNVFYNRLVWMNPDGNIQSYDKRHLFRFGNEHNYFSAGNQKKIFDCKDWNVCPMICYDLRFPVWARNTYAEEKFQYDLLIYLANWPEARKHHWQALLKARAIENLSYVIGVNRVGVDGKGVHYSGNSMVVSPRGEVLFEGENNIEELKTITLNRELLKQYRDKFNVALDWDEFQIMK